MQGNDASIKAYCICIVVKHPAAVIYSLAEEDKVQKSRGFPGWLQGFLAVTVLVCGLTFALAAPAGADSLQDAGRGGTAGLAFNPAAAPTPTPAPPARTAPPLSLTILLICTGGALTLVFGVIVLGFVLSFEKKKADQGETRS